MIGLETTVKKQCLLQEATELSDPESLSSPRKQKQEHKQSDRVKCLYTPR